MPRLSKRPSQTVSLVPWRKFFPLFKREFAQGQHVTILGPTGSGKTTLAIEVAEIREYSMFLATKPRDPLINQLKRRGWAIQEQLEVKIRDNGEPMEHRIVYWPHFDTPGLSIREKRIAQALAIQHALDYVFDAGSWAVVGDEVLWLTEQLRLNPELEAYWYQGRTSDISLICCSQRPAWIPRAAYSQSSHLFFFHTADREDQKRMGDITGVDVDVVRYETAQLGKHEFLYVNPHEHVVLRCKVEK